MQQNSFFNYNGKVFSITEKVIDINDRSYRYGDGCFETMKLINGKIILQNYHIERFTTSLQMLQFIKTDFFSTQQFIDSIIQLAKKNNHTKLARIRVSVSRGSAALYDEITQQPNYLIQTFELNNSSNELNENGLNIDFYSYSQKSCDMFSNIKSNNYLPYTLVALWAKQNKLNDALVFNSKGNICDASIANVFIIKNGIIKTPALAEGCIAGTMRKYLLNCFSKENILYEETSLTKNDVLNADEVFLTNAIQGIKWVNQCQNISYKNLTTKILYNNFIIPLFL
ncbi:MAG: aminotransferase class IV [Bacteroidetes bacterium]|nr:aminotransferase class IV [Bacteroidota bacterium]MBS1649743.1 aminotransferase class IV [Bacteroidota bacterium]